MRLLLATASILCLLGVPAFADDPPSPPAPPAPPGARDDGRVAPKPTHRPQAPPVPGVRWEDDFEEAIRRSAREGRPVFLAVAADERQPGGFFPAPEFGTASRPYVCLVGNNEDHPPKALPDGTSVCSRFGTGTCAAHKAALRFFLERLTSDGQTTISPAHAVLDPDGGVVFHGEYAQSAPSPAALDAMLVRVSPRVAMRYVWTAREPRMDALGKAEADSLEKDAKGWIGEGDALAPAGVCALLEQESKADRRAALERALASAGAAAAPLVFDAVDAATSAPDADPDGALRAAALAETVDPDLGGWAAARVLARAHDAKTKDRAKAAGVAAAAARRAAKAPPAATASDRTLAERLASLARSGRRAALVAAPAEDVLRSLALVRKALADPAEEVRVAAAIALKRAGDPGGADVLLAALDDPVEGPEARDALLPLAGSDLGERAAAWESWLREGKEAGK